MSNTPLPADLPPSLRLLKWLVITLTLTMIIGVITVVGLLVTRMPDAGEVLTRIPDQIRLPQGARPAAFTQGQGWFAVVTKDDRILIFNPGGELRQELQITP